MIPKLLAKNQGCSEKRQDSYLALQRQSELEPENENLCELDWMLIWLKAAFWNLLTLTFAKLFIAKGIRFEIVAEHVRRGLAMKIVTEALEVWLWKYIQA